MPSDDDQPGGGAQGALQPGTILSGTYEIVRAIGMGGMAEVYSAKNVHTDESVAIKVVLPEFARDQINLALFKKEATVLSRLYHDAIVRYQTFMVEQTMNRPYLVMEFVDGVPLSEHLKKAPLSAADTQRLVCRIAAGLAVAHAADVVHRDLSPDNIILPGDDVERAKIVDFGIAKAAKIGEGTLLGGKFAGKYNFVSPEQLGMAGGEITGQSDIYSLGLVAAAALLGRPLDMSGSQYDVLEKRKSVPDLSGIDPAMQPAVAAMLQPLPEHRPASMADVIAMIEGGPPPPMPVPPAAVPLTDTGTVIGEALPYSPPPKPVDPWSDRSPEHRSLPPQAMPGGGWPAPETSRPPQGSWQTPETSRPPQGSWPVQPPQTTPPQGSWQTERSQPPPGGWPQAPLPEHSQPPVYAPDPAVGAPAFPPPAAPPPAADSGAPRSESPFGPYEGPSGPPTFGKSRNPRPKPKGGNAGLLIGIAAVVVVLGGGALFFLQGGFGLLGGPAVGPLPTTTTTTTVPPVEPTTTTVPPVETTSVPPVTTTTQVPNPPETTTTTEPSDTVATLAGRIAWLEEYPLSDCEFAGPLAVAETAMTIEAIGTSAAPFAQLATDFQREIGFEPDIQVRPITEPQCPAADFLRAVQGRTVPGPTMTLTSDEVPSGDALEGRLEGTQGWQTEVLLVDYRGGVQSLSAYVTPTAGGGTLNLPLTSNATEPVPMMIMVIASHEGLSSTKLLRLHVAAQTFPIIRQEIESRQDEVAVSVRYFKLEPAP